MRNNILSAVCIALAILVSGAGNTASAKEAKDQKSYYLYGDARPGSKFKQKLFSDVVPFDKSYKEMSPGLQARVKAAYGGLADSEHPPFPTEGSQAIFNPLFKANRDLLDEGEVLAIALISSTGEPKKVTVYKAPSPNLASMMNYIIGNTKFDPAICDGEPCEMEYLFENKIDVMPSIAR